LNQVMKKLLGKFYVSVNKEVLFTSNPHVSFINALRGARLAVLSEIGEGDRLIEESVKKFTGGDPVVSRELYRSQIDFDPTFKLILLTNDLPESSCSSALWRRLILVEFKAKFCENPVGPNDKKIDTELGQKITDVKFLQSFFNYFLTYTKRWYQERLFIDEESRSFTNTRQKQLDNVASFFEDCLEQTSNDKDRINITDLYVLYANYCKSERIKNPKDKAKFKAEIISLMGMDEKQATIKSSIMYYRFLKWRITTDDKGNQISSHLVYGSQLI